MSSAERGCPGHADLTEELRRYAGEALDLLQPWVDRIREQPADAAAAEPAACTVCPVCAVITVARGGRSELAVRLAEHAAGVLAVLRTTLEVGIGTPTPSPPRSGCPEPHRPPTEPRPAGPRHRPSPRGPGRAGRVVQRIEVSRDGRGRSWGGPSREPC